jgi:hypothetical protein
MPTKDGLRANADQIELRVAAPSQSYNPEMLCTITERCNFGFWPKQVHRICTRGTHLFQYHQERTIRPSHTFTCPKTPFDPFVQKLIVRVVSQFQRLPPHADASIINISPTHHHRQHQPTWNDLGSLDQASVLPYEMASFSPQRCQTSASPFRLN